MVTKRKGKDKLTAKQEAFVGHYLANGFNDATQELVRVSIMVLVEQAGRAARP